MERHQPVDSASPARKLRTLILLGLVFVLPLGSFAQEQSADQLFQSGMASAAQQNWAEAKQTLVRGHQRFPLDPRFPTELGGVAFKEKNYEEALRWLKMARKLNPKDTYVHDFLGTVYYMTGDRYGAIESWNRAGKPVLASVRTEPTPKLDPVILDRAFAFAPGDVLTVNKLLTTEARLSGLGVFPKFDFYLAARPDGKFDITFYDQERNGFGRNKWEALLTTFGPLPGVYAVAPMYSNIRGSATNVTALLRFDPEKRRYEVGVSGPIRRNPRWRYLLAGGFRNENWNVRNFSSLPVAQIGSLNIRRTGVSAAIESIETDKFSWGVGGEYSYRDYRSVVGLLPAGLLLQGSQLKQVANARYELVRLPERHFTLATRGQSQLGRIWFTDGGHTFLKGQALLDSDWFLDRKGNDYELQQQVSVGGTAGDLPFDEYYVLGIDRDNTDLKMRGHYGTESRRKGNAPLGDKYFVYNWELDKNVYGNSLFRITVGPFVDTGKIKAPPQTGLGTAKWLWDAGAQAKFKALGMQLIIVYGKDLRTGDNSAYAFVRRMW